MSDSLRSTFDEMDIDKDGCLSLCEFLESGKRFDVDQQNLIAVFDRMDKRRAGSVSYEEYVQFCTNN